MRTIEEIRIANRGQILADLKKVNDKEAALSKMRRECYERDEADEAAAKVASEINPIKPSVNNKKKVTGWKMISEEDESGQLIPSYNGEY